MNKPIKISIIDLLYFVPIAFHRMNYPLNSREAHTTTSVGKYRWWKSPFHYLLGVQNQKKKLDFRDENRGNSPPLKPCMKTERKEKGEKGSKDLH